MTLSFLGSGPDTTVTLLASFLLFTIGLFGVLIKRDLPRIIISVSIMLGSVALLLVTLAQGNPANLSFVLFIWAAEVMEIIIGLAFFIFLNRSATTELNDLQRLKW
jgi:NADH-quinone oxidoreductase subunit K